MSSAGTSPPFDLGLTMDEFQKSSERSLPAVNKQHWFSNPSSGQGGSYYDLDLKDQGVRIDLIHACFGIAGEAGELIDPVKKAMFYGKPLDIQNIREEAGDLLWYIAGPLCRALGCSFEDLARENMAKLQKRYEAGYSDKAAIDRADKS